MSLPADTSSIRRRLLALLLIPTAAIAGVTTYGDYRAASSLFEAGYDQELLDAALAIASNIESRSAGERPAIGSSSRSRRGRPAIDSATSSLR